MIFPNPKLSKAVISAFNTADPVFLKIPIPLVAPVALKLKIPSAAELPAALQPPGRRALSPADGWPLAQRRQPRKAADQSH